jgi:excisionase family DNA binding protein
VYQSSGLDEANHLMSLSELAQWLNVSRGTVYNLLAEGLPYYRVGDRRFDREAVLRWLEDRKVSKVGA